MSCAARQWPTHRDLSKGMLVWMCVGVFKQVPNCWMWTQRTCTDFPGSMGVRGAEPRSKHSPSIISVVSGSNRPVTGTGVGRYPNRKWVGQSDFACFLRTSSNRTAAGWFARCDSSVHCRPLAARGVLFLILQFLSFSICFDFVLTYLLKRIKYKLIDK